MIFCKFLLLKNPFKKIGKRGGLAPHMMISPNSAPDKIVSK